MKSDLASASNRIINGKTAPSPIPWQVHLRQGSPSVFSYFCGGTIIDAKTILTAAHCFHGMNLKGTDFFVTAGIVHVDGAGQSAFVEKITLHESYDNENVDNDVAILKLKTPLTFYKNSVQRACLPEASYVPTGKAVASGWGLVAEYPNKQPENLQVCLQAGGGGLTLGLDRTGLTLVLGRY